MSGVEWVNAYIEENRKGNVRCGTLADKGRVLVSTRDFLPGEVIFSEEPLLQVATAVDNELYKALDEWAQHPDYDYATMWYWCALNSLISEEDMECIEATIDELQADGHGVEDDDSTWSAEAEFLDICKVFVTLPLKLHPEETLQRFRMFYHPEFEKPTRQAVNLSSRLIKHYVLELPDVDDRYSTARDIIANTFDPKNIDSVLQIWVLNCFEGDWDPLTYNTFYLPTFSSHSCLPNTVWHIDSDGDFVMVARLAIEAGEEISLSYLSDEDLILPSARRRTELMDTKQFICHCVRCDALADLSRGYSCLKCPNGMFFLDQSGVSSEHIPIPTTRGFQSQMAALEDIEKSLDTVAPYPCDWTAAKSAVLRKQLHSSQIQAWYQTIQPGVCVSCGKRADAGDIKQLVLFDESLWAAVNGESESAEKIQASLKSRYGKRLRSHFYVIRICDTLVQQLDVTESAADISRILRIKCKLCRLLYPAPFGLLAWAQKELVETAFSACGIEESPMSVDAVKEAAEHELFEDFINDKTPLQAANDLLWTFKLLFTVNHDFFQSNAESILASCENLKKVLEMRRSDTRAEPPPDWLKLLEMVQGVAACR